MKSQLTWQNIKKIFPLVLYIAPLFFFWVYGIWIDPSKNYYVNDAVFPYFINSLAVFDGGTYRYVDHPGTPVEILGSIILALTYPFLNNTPNGFVFYHLQNPELFFSLAHGFLVLAHILCIFIFYLFARWWINTSNSTLAASLAVMYFAIHVGSLGASMIWNHNSFSFPFGTLLLIFLFKVLRNGNSRQDGLSTVSLIGLGLGAGVFATFTIYLLAWLIGILFTIFLYYVIKRSPVLKTLSALAIVGISGVAGFFIATLPVLGKLKEFFNWVLRIFTHQSRYLAVSDHEPTFVRIQNNFINLGNSLPALAVAATITLILVIVVGSLFWTKKSGKADLWALTGGLTVQTVVLLFILLDRPSRDAYFLSLAAILPVLMMAVLLLVQSNPIVYRILAVATSVFVMVGVINTTVKGISTHQKEVSSLERAEMKVSEIVNNYAILANRDIDEIVILWTHDTYSTCWGLRLGNLKAGHVFTDELDSLCKNQFQLRNDFRVVMPSQSHRLLEVKWDIIFTCGNWKKRLMEYNSSIIFEHYYDIEWTCGDMLVAYKHNAP